MSDETNEKTNETEETSADDSQAAKKSGGARGGGASKIKMIILLVAALAVGGGAGWYFFKKKSNHKAAPEAAAVEPETQAEKVQELTKLVYMVLPEMVINLRTTPNGRASLLKCVFVLLLKSPEETKVVEGMKPQILDSFQSHIRELTLDQLEGAAGIERLRQVLADRVNTLVAPITIKRILIKEFITQ